jgi:hypothetical protein
MRAYNAGGIESVANDGAELLENTDSDPWEGPFSEYDKYGQPTGSSYVRCRSCGVEAVTGIERDRVEHRDGCAHQDDSDDVDRGVEILTDGGRDDPDEVVERTDVGASIEATITRGTGTRDQEKWRIKGKGRDADEAIDEFETQLDQLEDDLADRVRSLQPEQDQDNLQV